MSMFPPRYGQPPSPDPLTALAQARVNQRLAQRGQQPPPQQGQQVPSMVPGSPSSPSQSTSGSSATPSPQPQAPTMTPFSGSNPQPQQNNVRAQALGQLASQYGGGSDPLRQIAQQRLAAQGIHPPTGLNAPPPSATSTQMTAQSKGNNPFAGVNTNDRQDFGRGPQPSDRFTTPAQQTQQIIQAGQRLGQVPAAPTTQPPPSTSNAPPPTTTPAYDPNDPSTWGPSQAAAKQKAEQLAAQKNAKRDPRQEALAQLDAEQKQQMQAAKDQYLASKAQQEQNVASRSGLGGFGLSGASATMGADTARVADRNETLGLGQLASQQQTDRFRAVQQEAAVSDLEASENLDLDGDGFVAGLKTGSPGANGGKIGDGNPDHFGEPSTTPAPANKGHNKPTGRNADAVSTMLGGNQANPGGHLGDATSGNGSVLTPIPSNADKQDAIQASATKPDPSWILGESDATADYYYDPATKTWHAVPK